MSPLPLSAATRRGLVTLRRRAMRDGSAAAIGEFPGLTMATPAADQVALACLRAEILDLDGRNEDSLGVFDTEIEPLFPELAPAARIELLENKHSVMLSAWRFDGTHLSHQLADRRTLLDHPTRDYRRIVMANDAASHGEHYNALPDYWAELREAYAGLSWRRRAFAHADFARECQALRWVPQASYHIILAERHDLVDQLADTLARSNNPAVVSPAIRLALAASGLARHAAHAVRLLGKVADVLPDADMPVIVTHLLAWAALPVDSPAARHCFEPTWETIAHLAVRLDAAQAEHFIKLGVDHEGFARPAPARGAMLPGRGAILKAINPLLSRVTPECAAAIAPRLVAPATDLKCDVDYADALNALCSAVHRSADAQIRSSIGGRLYPPGQPITDAYLLQIAPVFGWSTRDRAQFNQVALDAAAAVRKQVERVPSGSEPAELGGWGTTAKPVDGGTLVVHMYGAQLWIDGVLANKQFLDSAAADGLAAALAETAANNDNTVANRIALIASLRKLADMITEPAAADCVAKLRRIAAGTFSESSVAMSHAEAANALNPFKMAMGDPAHLQAVALVALADFAACTAAAASALRDDGLLVTAMSDLRPIMRAHAAAAARALPTLTPDEVNALLLLTTDADADTAATALFAFRDAQRLELNRPQLALLLSVLERAAMRPEAPVRCVVAQVVGGLLKMEVSPTLKARREALASRLATDSAHSVRSGLDSR